MWNDNLCPNWAMWGAGPMGGIVQILLLALIIYIIYQLISSISARRRRGADSEAAGILANRYARGEISAEEFAEMKKKLAKK